MNTDIYKLIALDQCNKSTYKKRMGAVVVNSKRIVGKGYNKVHSTGLLLDGKHAELEALYNTKAKNREGSVVYVCRITKLGELALAKPCPACQTVMKKMGVKYVWYSTDADWIRMSLT